MLRLSYRKEGKKGLILMDDKLKTKGPVSEWTTVNKQTKTNIQSDKRAITIVLTRQRDQCLRGQRSTNKKRQTIKQSPNNKQTIH